MVDFTVPDLRPEIAQNIDNPRVRDLILTHLAMHVRDCETKLIDPTYDVAIIWRAFSNPERIGFLTHERFNRLLNETPSDLLDVGTSMQQSIADAKEHPENFMQIPLSIRRELYSVLKYEIANADANCPYLKKYGQMTKPGRILRKLRPNAADDDVEHFATQWKAAYEPQQTHVEIVDDVPYAYDSEHYQTCSGTIMSCMTNELRYVQFYNLIGAKAAVLKNQHHQILARAIYWPSINFSGGPTNVPLMDRVYVSDEHYYQLMYDWAQENNIYRKREQNYTSKTRFIGPNGESIDTEAYINDVRLENIAYYPYMDTFTWFDCDTSELRNTPDNITDGYVFESTSGGYDHINNEDMIYVEGVGDVPEDDVVYNRYDEPILRDDAVMVAGVYYHQDNPDIVETPDGEYILMDDSILTEHGEFYHVDCPDLVEPSDGLWYHIDDPEIGTDYVYCEDTDRYIPAEDAHESTIEARTFFETESSRDRYDDEQMHARDRQQTLIA